MVEGMVVIDPVEWPRRQCRALEMEKTQMGVESENPEVMDRLQRQTYMPVGLTLRLCGAS